MDYTRRSISCLSSVPPGKFWKKSITLNLATDFYLPDFFSTNRYSLTNLKFELLLYKLMRQSQLSLAYSMEKSPTCETNRFSFSQEIPLILCNPKFIITFTRAQHLSLFIYLFIYLFKIYCSDIHIIHER